MSRLTGTGADGAAVDHEAGAVQARHACVPKCSCRSRGGDVGIVPLAAHDGLDGVRDEIRDWREKDMPGAPWSPSETRWC